MVSNLSIPHRHLHKVEDALVMEGVCSCCPAVEATLPGMQRQELPPWQRFSTLSWCLGGLCLVSVSLLDSGTNSKRLNSSSDSESVHILFALSLVLSRCFCEPSQQYSTELPCLCIIYCSQIPRKKHNKKHFAWICILFIIIIVCHLVI